MPTTDIKAPVITVKSLKFAEFASEETYCFEATVYVDGKRFCKSKNDGHGGSNMDMPVNGMTWKDLNDRITELNKLIAATAEPPPDDAPDWEKKFWNSGHRPDFETRVNEAVTNALILREMKSKLKSHLLYEDPKDGLYEIKLAGRPADALAGVLKQKYGDDIVVLNLLPEHEAFEIFRRY